MYICHSVALQEHQQGLYVFSDVLIAGTGTHSFIILFFFRMVDSSLCFVVVVVMFVLCFCFRSGVTLVLPPPP